MLSISSLFDEQDYLAQNPDVRDAIAAGAFSNGFDHFNQFGQREGRNPSASFDTAFYLALYPDVAEAVDSGQITAVQHFIDRGQFEGRDPLPEFFTEVYLELYPDVAEAVEADLLTAYQHFLEVGQFEGRDPGFGFDTPFYLDRYPDVAAAITPGGLSAIGHYLQFGFQEGRFANADEVPLDLSSAENLGSLGAIARSEFVGNADRRDLYSFTVNTTSSVAIALEGLSADADLILMQDRDGNGEIDADFEVLDFSDAEGAASEAINTILPGGSYFILVEQFEGETNYNLNLSATPFTPPADTVGNTPAASRNLGTLNASQTTNEFVGTIDPQDYYRFTLETNSSLNLTLENLKADADLFLFQDTNGNGTLEEDEEIEFSDSTENTSEGIFLRALNAGTYFVLVKQYSGDTTYTLNLSAEAVTIPADAAGSSLATARDLGTLSNSQTVSDFVGTIDPADFYRFSVNGTTDLNVNLTDLTADADIFLILDRNGDGAFDATEEIEFSDAEGTASETIAIAGLPAGTYFIGVEPYQGDTPYTLTLSGTASNAQPISLEPQPGDSISTAIPLSQAIAPTRALQIGPTSTTAVVNADNPRNFYSFTADQPGIFNADLLNLTGDADVRLIRDWNGNGITDPVADRNGNGFIDDDEIEVVAWLPNRGPANESIRRFLQPGAYALEVISFNKQSTGYTLNTNFTPAPSDPLAFAMPLNFAAGTEDLTEAERNVLRQAGRRLEQLVTHSTFPNSHTLAIEVTATNQDPDVLASAGPTNGEFDLNRREMPTQGEASINSNPESDVRANARYLYDTMIHEFAHVLGIGTLWEDRNLILNPRDGLYNPTTYAGVMYGELLGTFTPTPVELTVNQGPGSDLGHWRKIPNFDNEIMVESGSKEEQQVTSQLTIATLRDLGWNVNYGAAEAYTLPQFRPLPG